MRTTPHGDRLAQLTRLGAVNCYLVAEDDGLTLVDTMISGSAGGILAAARQLGAPIVRVALTHAHSDHVGSVDALRRELPDAEISITARDARFLRGDRSLDAGEPQGKPRGGLPTLETAPDRELHAGETVGSLEVVPSPGHTPGHAAFLDRRDRTLIAGDALQTLGGIAVSGTVRPLFPFPALATWDKALARQSAQALRALGPSRLAVGHGRVLEDPLAEIDRAIAAAK